MFSSPPRVASGRPVIGLASRGNRMDGYVFTLLHELAQLCLGRLEALGVRRDGDAVTALGGAEVESSHQAAGWILPRDTPLPAGSPSIGVIFQIASGHRIPASFVIGRIQRDRGDWGLSRSSIPKVRPYIAAET